MSSTPTVETSDPRVAGWVGRLAAVQAQVAAIGVEVARVGSGLGVEDVLGLCAAGQGVVNAGEGVVVVAAAHAGSHEHRLTSDGLVEIQHAVGFIDAMAPSEVALVTGSTVGVAGHRVQLGADLAQRFPQMLAGVLSGSVNAGTARKVVSACEGLDGRSCALVEAVLVQRLPELDPARVTAVARRVAHRVAPGQAAAQVGRNRRGRCVEVSPGPDGTTSWWALLPAADSAVAWSAVKTLAEDYQQGDPALSVDQARADAMVDLLLRQVTVTASVTLGIPVLTTPGPTQCDPLTDATTSTTASTVHEGALVPDGLTIIDHDSGELVAVADLTPASRAGLRAVPGWFGTDPPWFCGEPGWGAVTVMAPTNGGTAVSGCAIPGVGWVEAATVASICSTFPLSVGRALLDTTTGTLLETTTTAYKPTKAIREHVTLRDGTCRMWGCTAPANALDLDHTRPWPAGATTASNLAGLCRRHHRMKQHARWRYTLTPDGTITWISPTGTTRVTHPEHTHWPPPSASRTSTTGDVPRTSVDQHPAIPPF